MNIRIRAAAAIAAGVLALTACSSPNGGTSSAPAPSAPQSAATDGDLLSVANVVNGPLGDRGFFDDAERGIQKLAPRRRPPRLQAEANNPAQWKTNLESVSGQRLGHRGRRLLADGRHRDRGVDRSSPTRSSSSTTPRSMPPTWPRSSTSRTRAPSWPACWPRWSPPTRPSSLRWRTARPSALVGGMDIPVINDFVVGYKAGVEAVDPSRSRC